MTRRRTGPAPPADAYIALGANLGAVRAALDAGFEAIARLPRTALRAASSLYLSAPVDAGGADYLNAVVAVQTRLAPLALLDALQAIERRLGRQRPYPNAPRTLDLDLLLYADLVVAGPRLTLPHPRLHRRAFVLLPLAEIDPGLSVPGLGSVGALLAGVVEQRIVRLPPTATRQAAAPAPAVSATARRARPVRPGTRNSAGR